MDRDQIYLLRFMSKREKAVMGVYWGLIDGFLWVQVRIRTWRYGRATRRAPAKRVYVGENPTTASTSGLYPTGVLSLTSVTDGNEGSNPSSLSYKVE